MEKNKKLKKNIIIQTKQNDQRKIFSLPQDQGKLTGSKNVVTSNEITKKTSTNQENTKKKN